MMYRILVYKDKNKSVDQKDVYTLQEARDYAQRVVQDRMEAFSDDTEALTKYGFMDAEDQAMDMGEDGGTIFMQDGWKIEVAPLGQDVE